IAQAGLPSRPVEESLGRGFPNAVVVAQLDDDNGDGVIDRHDTANMVLLSRTSLEARDLATGDVLFTHPFPSQARHLAVADLDDDGIVEILVSDQVELLVFEHDGTPAWSRTWPIAPIPGFFGFGVADLNQDGVPDIYSGPTVTSVDESLSWSDVTARIDGVGPSPDTHVADFIPESPGLELLAGRYCYRADGSRAWTAPVSRHGLTTVGDLDGDGDPEIALSVGNPDNEIVLLDHLGRRLGGLSFPPLPRNYLPSIFLFDVDGDGRSELLVSFDEGLILFDWDGSTLTPRWQHPNGRSPWGESMTAYDFDGDGRPELVYINIEGWWILDGMTGELLHGNPDLQEGDRRVRPIIANLDDDSNAEIVVALPSLSTFTVHEVGCSTTPLGIWNQRDYHVTNVDLEGRIPRVEEPAWNAGRQWWAQSNAADSCGLLSGVTGSSTLTPCPGDEVVLDASDARLTTCEAELVFEWISDGELLGSEPVLVLTPESPDPLLIELTVGCGDAPCCRGTFFEIIPRAPFLEPASARDDDPCTSGIDLSWSEADFRTDGPNVYNVYRSVGPDASCDDALSRPPIVSGLAELGWRDETTLPEETHVYVVEAEALDVDCSPLGPAGGAVSRSCLPPVVDVTTSVVEPATVASCDGEPITLDASSLFESCPFATYLWTDGSGWASPLPAVTVLPEVETTYQVTVTCFDRPDCEVTWTVIVQVADGPVMGPTSLSDNERCLPGILIRWIHATWSDPDAGGVYHVHRSDGPTPSCEDALSRPALAEGLTGTQFFDETTEPGSSYVYVLVAEDALPHEGTVCPVGPTHGGLVTTECLPVFQDVAVEEPDVVWSPLRGRHDLENREEVTFFWPTARSLLDGETFVLLKAVDEPWAEFSPVTLSAPEARSYTEIDTSSPRQFFDLRVGNCRGLSVDEYPPGP
ncbi:MAG: FG-GAP-like repeat-containing protein, partial [Acidobacteriota bacterium]